MTETTRTDRIDGDIDWPPQFNRTAPARREHTSKFKVGLRDTIDELAHELETSIGVDDWRLSTAAAHQKQNPKYPYADAQPDDSGAVVRWTMGGDQYAVACDQYTQLRDNCRALLLYLREKRKMENRPVTTGQSEFATARLPPGDEPRGDTPATPVAPEMNAEEAAELLGVAPDSPERVVKTAFEEVVKDQHPDAGGDGGVARLKAARDTLLEDP